MIPSFTPNASRLQDLKTLLSTDLSELIPLGTEKEITPPEIAPGEELNLAMYDKQWDEYVSHLKKKARPVIFNPISVKILAIADTHGMVSSGRWLLNSLKAFTSTKFDIILLLGDIPTQDIEKLLRFVSGDLVLGVLGNHDNFDTLEKVEVEDLNQKVIITGENRWLAGLEGSIKYKDSNNPMLSHNDSITATENIWPVDVFISHDTYYHIGNPDLAHKGLVGISKYLYENRVPYHIHGHTHQRTIETLENGTTSIGVYGAAIININNEQINVHNIATG